MNCRTPGRKELQPGQVSRIEVVNKDTGARRTVLELDTLVEAPNWTRDGRWLVINGGGKLWKLPADGSGGLEPIPTGRVDNCNNDHVLSPDNAEIFVSSAGHLYRLPFAGGEPVQVSNDHPADSGFLYYLHGISPDAGDAGLHRRRALRRRPARPPQHRHDPRRRVARTAGSSTPSPAATAPNTRPTASGSTSTPSSRPAAPATPRSSASRSRAAPSSR